MQDSSSITLDRVSVIKALAHPTRLRIIEFLSSGPRCVSAIQAEVGSDLSTVSKHLSLMREAGWVSCEKRGLQIYYEIACTCLEDFLRCVDTLARETESDGEVCC